jgi:RND family efflux transporter MFP subunit
LPKSSKMNPSLRSHSRTCTLLCAGVLLLLAGCDKPDADPEKATAPAPDTVVAHARGRVDIEGGLIRLAGSNDGLVQSVHVEEGERVHAGQLLAVIDDRPARLALAIGVAAEAEARAALEPLRVRLAAAGREAARLGALRASDSAPAVEIDQASDLAAQLHAELRTAEAALATATARLRADEHELERRSIRAPLDGRIVKRTARPGDGVSTLNVTPLFLFAPDSPRIVRADLDERFVDRVQPGMVAEIVIDTDTPRTVPGRVLRVGEVFGAKTPTGEPGERVDLRVVECVIALEDQTLRLGQRVLVRILP